MYVPKHYEETDVGVLHRLIGAHPLGTWVAPGESGLVVNHIPFIVEPDRGRLGTLVGHVARANPAWRIASPDVPSVVVFQGPQSYVSPSWYRSKTEHGRVVPTWNYAVVHAHGRPRIIHDTAWLRDLVGRLTAAHESQRPRPWRITDAPEEYIARSLEAIVGIEIPLDRLEGKWKMSQNQPPADRRGIVEGLRETKDAAAGAVADEVERRGKGPDRRSG